VVAIRLKDAATFEPFMSTFLYVQQASDIQGSVSLLLGTRFQSFRVGSKIYHVGQLPWWKWLTLWFMEHAWVVAAIVFVLAGLLAIWVRQWLRVKARARLKVADR
jgi:cellulose synthase (UDP-forming)